MNQLITHIAEIACRIVELFKHYETANITDLTMPGAVPGATVTAMHDGKYQALVLYPLTDTQVNKVLACLESTGYIGDSVAEDFDPWCHSGTPNAFSEADWCNDIM